MAEHRPATAPEWSRPRLLGHGQPYLDELWQVSRPQAAAQIASLAGGDVQMVFEVPVPFIGSLQRNPAVSIAEVNSRFVPAGDARRRTRSPSTTAESASP